MAGIFGQPQGDYPRLVGQPVRGEPRGVNRGMIQRHIQRPARIERHEPLQEGQKMRSPFVRVVRRDPVSPPGIQGAKEGVPPVGAGGRDAPTPPIHPHRPLHWQQVQVGFVHKQQLPVSRLHLGLRRHQRGHLLLSLRIHATPIHGSQAGTRPAPALPMQRAA